MSSPFFSKHTYSNALSLSKNMSAQRDYVTWYIQRMYRNSYKEAHHHELLIHRRQWIKSMTWSKCLKIPEFHIPNVTFGKHQLRTHKPKADEMFATASSRHLKSFPSSRGNILWGQGLGFCNCSRLLLQIRTNQGARTQDRQTTPSPRWAARLSFSKSGFLCTEESRLYTKGRWQGAQTYSREGGGNL